MHVKNRNMRKMRVYILKKKGFITVEFMIEMYLFLLLLSHK